MRAVVLDTETTGFSPAKGDRIISIGLIELEDRKPTGRYLHHFVDPGRDSSPGALKVHGITTEFLIGKPVFSEIVDELLNFTDGSPLIAHNAAFDRMFLEAELSLADRSADAPSIWICTKLEAQRRFGLGGNKLDDLVRRFGIPDLRTELGAHGALVDALLLTAVLGPLYGLPCMVDFQSPSIRDMINEASRDTGGGRATQEPGAEAALPERARAGGEGTGAGVGGNTGVPNSAPSGAAEPTGTTAGDSCSRGGVNL